MDSLRPDDFMQALDLIRDVSSASDPDDFLSRTLRGVVRLIPCMVATINEVVPQTERIAFWMEPPSFPVVDDAPQLLAELAPGHPMIRHVSETGDGSARRISDFWTEAEFHASPLYQRLYGPMGVEYQMSVTLPAPRPTVLGLAVSRGDRDFSERDRDALNLVRPHLAQAWRNARDQERLRGLLAAAHEAVTGRRSGLIVLWDPPEELTPGALVSVYRYFGRPSKTSTLPARVARWVTLQRARLQAQDRMEMTTPLRTSVDGRELLLRYLPGQASHPGAIVLAERSLERTRHSFEDLGLTKREAEIVRLVISGASNSAVAATLKVSPGTVKKHLDNIYEKLGVHGRGMLTAFVLDISNV
jgi:DNA-binding CsgD family transcriptional regulator